MQILVQPLGYRKGLQYSCFELSEFREEATAPTAMQSQIPVQLILEIEARFSRWNIIAFSWPASRSKVTHREKGRLSLLKPIV